MVFLVVLSLILALVALAAAGLAIVRARASEERAVRAESAAARAESGAHAARIGLDQLEGQVSRAHDSAEEATHQATRSAQAAAEAAASAAAARREAEDASDRAAHAESEATTAHRIATSAVAPPTEPVTVVAAPGLGGAATVAGTAMPSVEGARATVHRAEDRSVSGRMSGETERVVQVSWQLEHVRGSVWALRNTGLVVAHDALLSEVTLPPKYIRPDEVIPRDVPRDDVLQFRVMASRGAPPPRVRVTWREGSASPAYSREFTVLSAS